MRDEIIQEIKALSLHYPKRARSPADEARWLTDYADDLERFEVADVRLACRIWRTSDERHMPTPGDLIRDCRQLVKPALVYQAPRNDEPTPNPDWLPREVLAARMLELARDLGAKMKRMP